MGDVDVSNYGNAVGLGKIPYCTWRVLNNILISLVKRAKDKAKAPYFP